ncbi:MAG: MOSC domain-containing protein [Candidatus Omnitrophica bacterium]|nr:MOSC domain-containing protein [Candidatus Omnitrophota bacterium]
MLPRIVSINISKGGIPKLPVPAVRLTVAGLEGDGHNHAKHNTPLQAVCIQDLEKLGELSQSGYLLSPGQAGENLTVENLYANSLPLGAILEFSGGVILEISKVRKPCYVMDAIHPRLKTDALGRHGMYAKVIEAGTLRVGETIEVVLPAEESIPAPCSSSGLNQ